ncbi:MAG: molybdate ABC transporter substrate-binding protein, partial [Pseudonocardiaceae bacterium]
MTVLAAASLTGVFDTLEPLFEKDNPGTDLRFSFAGSSDLAQQIVNGAPADVFASANPKQMMMVANANMVEGTSANFASNLLTIAVPRGNPAGITAFADLADPARTVVV